MLILSSITHPLTKEYHAIPNNRNTSILSEHISSHFTSVYLANLDLPLGVHTIANKVVLAIICFERAW